MALQWFRKHQKRVLYPLSVIVIVTFVFWGGSRRAARGPSDEVVAQIGGDDITRNQLLRYMNILRRLRPSMYVETDEFAPIRYLWHARAARQHGVSVSKDQLKDVIRAIMSSGAWLGTDEFTDAEYRQALAGYHIIAAEFERFIEEILAGDFMAGTVASTAFLTEQEMYIAYCRQKDKIRLRTRDFPVKDFQKDVKAPSEEDLRKYYDEHKGLHPESELALAAEPEVAIDFFFVDSRITKLLVEALERAAPICEAVSHLAGGMSGLAGSIGRQALAAALEKDLRNRYESSKNYRFRLPPETEKKQEPSGSISSGGPGLASMVALPALGAASSEGTDVPPQAPQQLPAAQEAPAKPQQEERFRPFEEVRGELEKELAESTARTAAHRRADEVRQLAGRWARMRALGDDILLAGCSPAVAALRALGGVSERVELLRACEELGAIFGTTDLKKPSELKAWPPLGDLRGLANRAVSIAKKTRKGETIGRLQPPAIVEKGWAGWRVAGYVPARTLEFEEAKETIRERLIHIRAAELARDAAEQFLQDLQAGKADVNSMPETPLLIVTSPRARPFALLGVGEPCSKPVAIRADRPDEPALDESTPLEQIGLYRVGLLTERVSPSLEEFRKDNPWRDASSGRLQHIQRLFMREHWLRDEAGRSVELRFLKAISEEPTTHRGHAHESEEEE